MAMSPTKLQLLFFVQISLIWVVFASYNGPISDPTSCCCSCGCDGKIVYPNAAPEPQQPPPPPPHKPPPPPHKPPPPHHPPPHHPPPHHPPPHHPPPHYPPPHYPPPHHPPPHGPPPHGRPPHGRPPHGQPPHILPAHAQPNQHGHHYEDNFEHEEFGDFEETAYPGTENDFDDFEDDEEFGSL